MNMKATEKKRKKKEAKKELAAKTLVTSQKVPTHTQDIRWRIDFDEMR
jgi:hypothetical protein